MSHHKKVTTPARRNEVIKTVTLEDVELRVSNLEKWLKRLIGASGLTLAALLTFAFFLGSAYTKVSDASEKTDRLYGVVAVDKDSIQARATACRRFVTADLSGRWPFNKGTAGRRTPKRWIRIAVRQISSWILFPQIADQLGTL